MPKMNNKWIALCTAAVGVVYAAGYVVTEANSANASSATTQPTATRPSKVTRSADSTRSFYREKGKRFGQNHDGMRQERDHSFGGAILILEEQTPVQATLLVPKAPLPLRHQVLHQAHLPQPIKMELIRVLVRIDLERFQSL
jgi:hypothetical protein